MLGEKLSHAPTSIDPLHKKPYSMQINVLFACYKELHPLYILVHGSPNQQEQECHDRRWKEDIQLSKPSFLPFRCIEDGLNTIQATQLTRMRGL